MTADLQGTRLIFRCDATNTIGTGHVMRCLALAQGWKNAGGDAIFAIAQSPEKLLERLSNAELTTVRVNAAPGSPGDAAQVIAQTRRAGAKWIVVDGDHFSSEFLAQLKDAGIRVLLLDDFAGRSSFPVDVIVNSTYGATEEPYRLAGFDGLLLLGERHILLRSEFTNIAAQDRPTRQKGNRILITLGGSDPDNLSPKLLESLAGLSGLEITLVAGAGYAHADDLRAFESGRVKILFDVTDMPSLMRAADMAIIVAGGTLWELLYLGCTVLTYSRNDLQASVMGELADQGIVAYMGDIRQFSGPALASKVQELANAQELRQEMAHAGRQLVDGRGALRIIDGLLRGDGAVEADTHS